MGGLEGVFRSLRESDECAQLKNSAFSKGVVGVDKGATSADGKPLMARRKVSIARVGTDHVMGSVETSSGC
ncbi:hypothetical protein Tco_1306029 [Tanacetum coccineum]